MRVLIVNSNQERSPWPVPPLGACAVASSVSEVGHDVRMLDLTFVRKTRSAVARAVEDFRPEVIGIGVRNIDNVDWQAPHFYLPRVKADVVDVCRARGGCPIVIGGPAASIMPGEMLEYMEADFVLRGDGEAAMVDLLAALGGAGGLEDVAGLAWRDGGGIRCGEPARVADLDALPLPRGHPWVNLRRYLAYNGSLGVQTKRGCAMHCTYCVYNKIEGARYRLKSPARVAEEVADAIEAGGAGAIEFVDSTFNVPLAHALDVCRALISRGLKAQFNTMGINPGSASEELFGLLRRAGFCEVSITPETASEEMLASLGKGFTRADLVRSAQMARRARLPVVWYFLFGGPGETEQTVRESLRFMDEHIPPEHLVLMVSGIRLFPGAPLADRARREGQIAPGASLVEPVWYRPPIERRRLFALLDEAMARHPNYIALQDNHAPRPLVRAVLALQRFFRSRRPIWQFMRHVRRLQTTFGLPQHLLAGAGRCES